MNWQETRRGKSTHCTPTVLLIFNTKPGSYGPSNIGDTFINGKYPNNKNNSNHHCHYYHVKNGCEIP